MSFVTVALVVIAAIAAWLLIPKKVVDRSADPLPAPVPAQDRRSDPLQSFRENAPLAPHAAATEEKLAIVDAAIRERYAKKFRDQVLDELKELTKSDD
jgi:hypothetical protein